LSWNASADCSYMLTQQVARYLLKTARELQEKKGHVQSSASNPTIEYLKGMPF